MAGEHVCFLMSEAQMIYSETDGEEEKSNQVEHLLWARPSHMQNHGAVAGAQIETWAP